MDLQPSISLAYNSGAGSGPLGVGWSITGLPLSVITRCKTSIALDGDNGPVDFAGSTYCLDNQRLIAVPSKPNEYRTEVDSFAKVVLNGLPTAPESFTIFLKNGLILSYGGNSNARATGTRLAWGLRSPDPNDLNPPTVTDTTEQVYAWGLDSVTDRVGSLPGAASNMMTVQYINESGNSPRFPAPFRFSEFLPETIFYGTGASSRVVRFIYGADRSDASYTFSSGLGIKHTRLLTRIVIETAAQRPVLRSYDLTYDQAPETDRPRLQSVKECDQFQKCKRPTTFDWENGSSQYDEVIDTAPMTAVDNSQFWVRDMDGDGKDDIVYSISADRGEYMYRQSLGTSLSPFEVFLLKGVRQPGISATIVGVYPADLDLNGRADLSHVEHVINTTDFGPRLASHGDHTVFNPLGSPAAYFADMDGDGLPEVVAHSHFVCCDPNSLQWMYARNAGRPFGSGVFQRYQPLDPIGWAVRGVRSAPSYMIGLDASGRQALLFQSGDADHPSSRYRVAQMKRSGDMQTTPTTLRVADSNPGGRYYVMIDVNGDGLTDALEVSDSPYFPSTKSQGAALSVNTGAGFTGPANTQGAPFVAGVIATQELYSFNTEQQPGYAIADLNQDGLPDIIFMGAAQFSFPGGGAARTEVVALKAASGTTERANWVTGGNLTLGTNAHIPVAAKLNNNYAFAQVGDFNGDGLVDFIERPANDPGHFHLYIHRGKKADQMVGVTTSINGRTEISYKSIADPTVHAPAADCTYPLYCLKRGVWVVDNFWTSSDLRSPSGPSPGSPILNSFSLQYAGARNDALRGWLGFAQQTLTDVQTGRVTVTTYDNTTKVGEAYPYAMLPSKRGTIAQEQTFAAFPLSRAVTRHDYETVPLAGSAIYSVRERQTSETSERLTTAPAMPLSDAVFDTSLPRQPLFSATTTFTYDAYNTVTDATTRTGGNNVQQTSCPMVENDPATWLIGACRKVVETSTTSLSKSATRTRTIDYYPGTLLERSVTIEPTGDDSVRSTTVYQRDSSGHGRVTGITTTAKATAQDKSAPPGQTLTRHWDIAYDPSDGIFPVAVTNPLGQTTRMTYHSGLGVLTSVTDPNHVVTTYQFDGFGRPVGIQPPGGGQIRISYLLPMSANSSLWNGSKPEYVVRTEQIGGGNLWGKNLSITYNQNNHEILREMNTGDGSTNQKLTGYSMISGQVSSQTRWFKSGSNRATTRFEYDKLGRVLSVSHPDSSLESYYYDVVNSGVGASTAQIHKLVSGIGEVVEVDLDELGRISKRIEKDGGGDDRIPSQSVTSYTYAPFGLLDTVVLPPVSATGFAAVFLGHDALGRRTSWLDRDRGQVTTSYNAFGDVVAEFDAAGAATSYVRDALGRVTERQNLAGVGDQQTYVWDTAPNGIGKLASSYSHSLGGVGKKYGYDYFGRLQSTHWDIATSGFNVDHQTFVMERTYDGLGRLDRIKYPYVGDHQFAVQLQYDRAGNLAATVAQPTGLGSPPSTPYWAVNTRTAENQISLETAGSGVQTSRNFDPERGWLNSIVSPVQNLIYDHDERGNVTGRQDLLGGSTNETFTYSDLDMLHRWTFSSPSSPPMTGNVAFYPEGDGTIGGRFMRIASPVPSSQGSLFDYSGASTAHAVSTIIDWGGVWGVELTYDANGNQTSASNGLKVGMLGYTSFGLPAFIGTAQGSVLETLKYDAGGRRAYKANFARGGSVPDETFYVGDLYEMRRGPGGTTHVFYVPGEGRIVAQETWTDDGSGRPTAITPHDTLYFHDDIIGSLDAISSASGQNNAQLRYDPFGRRVDPTDYRRPGAAFAIPGVPGSTVTRGFTMHEMDDETGFINMRGRLFDPLLCRFLTPDPVREVFGRAASYDPYAYVENNPLRFTDPTGFYKLDLDPGSLGKGSSSGGSPVSEPGDLVGPATAGFVDLTGRGPIASGVTVGFGASSGSAGPGGAGIGSTGAIDDGPSASGGVGAQSPVAGNPYEGRGMSGGAQPPPQSAPPRSNSFGTPHEVMMGEAAAAAAAASDFLTAAGAAAAALGRSLLTGAGYVFLMTIESDQASELDTTTMSIDADKPANEVLPGSLRREFPGEHLDKSLNQIKEALRRASGNEKNSLQKAKKILEQSDRLLDKVRNKP